MPLRLFCWHPPAWWGRAQGCGCGWSCRKGPPRSFYRSAAFTLYICFVLSCLSGDGRLQTYGPSFFEAQPENQPRPDERTNSASRRPLHTRRLHTSAVCRLHIPFACSKLSLRRRCQLRFSAAASTARHLLPACLPNHCWLCEAGRYRPVSSSSLPCPSSLITLKPTPQPCHGHPSVMQALQMRKRRRSSDADGHGRDVQPLDKVRCC